MEQAQLYFVFDDGRILSVSDREPCTFEMRNGEVQAVVFEDESNAGPAKSEKTARYLSTLASGNQYELDG